MNLLTYLSHRKLLFDCKTECKQYLDNKNIRYTDCTKCELPYLWSKKNKRKYIGVVHTKDFFK